MPNTTSIPAPRVGFIDERTGLMSREWYRFFLNLYTLTGSGGNAITLDDVQLGPATIALPADANFVGASNLDSQVAQLAVDLQGLALAPVATSTTATAATGPVCYVSGSGAIPAQTVVTGTDTIVNPMDTIVFDPSSAYNLTTNRFVPQTAGYYSITAIASFAASAGVGFFTCALFFKNGTRFDLGNATAVYPTIPNFMLIQSLVYMNGTTDYIELGVYQNAGSNKDTNTGGVSFKAFWVKS